MWLGKLKKLEFFLVIRVFSGGEELIFWRSGEWGGDNSFISVVVTGIIVSWRVFLRCVYYIKKI